ncbi:MAG TPA: DUF6263 family protein [Bacteroidota bacterium]|nr:DUF6263 family protein [Bacteroidota bacterium]
MLRLMLSSLAFLLLACSACKQADENATPDASAADSLQQAIPADERGTPVQLDAPLQLAYRFSKGDSFGFRVSSTQKLAMRKDTAGTSFERENNEQELTYWYMFEVLEAFPEGGGRLRATCDRVLFKGSYEGPQGKRDMAYDSQVKNTYDIEKLYAQYNAPVGAPYEITVSKDGRVASINNMDAVVRNFLKDDFATTKSNQIDIIKRDYAESGLKSHVQLMFQSLPDKPLAVDSSWTLVVPGKQGYLQIRNDATYTLASVVKTDLGTLAQITGRIKSSYTGPRTMDTGQGMATIEEFNIKGSTRTALNTDKGRVHRRALSNSVRVRMFIEPPEELKRMMPEMRDFWWVQDASTQDTVEPYSR